jgi:hypothetical protein
VSHKQAQKAPKIWFLILCLFVALFVAEVKADDGYRLWLRYDQLSSRHVKSILVQGDSATFDLIRGELSHVKVGEGDASVVVGLRL